MADNVAVTAGVGTAISTDERSIGGNTVHIQRIYDIGGSAITGGQTEISNANTAIRAAADTRKRIVIVNRQTVPVYIGASAATTGMFRLDPGDSVSLYTTAAVNGITAAAYAAVGDAMVHWIEETS